MNELNQSSCSQVGITCLFEHVATSRDSLLQTDGQAEAAVSHFSLSDTVLLFLKLCIYILAVYHMFP